MGFADTNLPMNNAKPSSRKMIPVICSLSLIVWASAKNVDTSEAEAEVVVVVVVSPARSAHSEVNTDFRQADREALFEPRVVRRPDIQQCFQ